MPSVRAVRDFSASEAAGGIALIAAAAAALLVANSPLAEGYERLLAARLGPLSLLHWINDGAMALFFLLVGLEIKRELVVGRLACWSDRALPLAAALGGMAAPAAIYLLVAGAVPGLARGWAIPSATDIAFALAVVLLLGDRVPASLRLFLTSVAILDDLGAVAIIALVYTARLDPAALAAAGAILVAMTALNRAGVQRLAPYLVLAAALWLAVHASGVHATVAGVLAAMTIPLSDGLERAPSSRLEHALQPWVAFAVLPLFGFANAGVSFAGVDHRSFASPLPLAIAAGLLLGKQTGILGGVWLLVRTRGAHLPAGVRWRELHGIALLCGIGFTMSLFIGALAFADAALAREVKLGVLAGSLLSGLAGATMLARWRGRGGAINAPL